MLYFFSDWAFMHLHRGVFFLSFAGAAALVNPDNHGLSNTRESASWRRAPTLPSDKREAQRRVFTLLTRPANNIHFWFDFSNRHPLRFWYFTFGGGCLTFSHSRRGWMLIIPALCLRKRKHQHGRGVLMEEGWWKNSWFIPRRTYFSAFILDKAFFRPLHRGMP